MNPLNQHFKIFGRNWKLGLMVSSITVFFLLPAILVSDHFDTNAWWFIMTSLVIAGMALGYFVAETQKELMSRGAGFLLPGLGRLVNSSQIIIMVAAGLTAFLLAFFLPALAPVTTGNVLRSLSLSCLVMAAFSSTLLIDFLFRYSSWLTSFILLPFFLYIYMGKNADALFYQHWLGNSGILLMVSLLYSAISFNFLNTLNLPRRLAENPYISTLELYRPARVQEFKNKHAAHAQPKNKGDRPLKYPMDLCLTKSSQARFNGKESQAIFWDTLYLGLATGIPRGLLGAWNYVPFILPFVLAIGYADSMRTCSSGMVGWFSAFPFMFATLPTAGFHFLGISPLGFPRSREATEKAGYIFTAWSILAVILLTVFIFGMMHFLGAVMPEFETAGRLWSYHPPSRFHTPFLPLLIMPVTLFIYLLWPRSSAQMILWGSGMQVFLFFNFGISGDENGWVTAIILGISLAAWVALPFLWRRRIRAGI